MQKLEPKRLINAQNISVNTTSNPFGVNDVNILSIMITYDASATSTITLETSNDPRAIERPGDVNWAIEPVTLPSPTGAGADTEMAHVGNLGCFAARIRINPSVAGVYTVYIHGKE